MLTTNMSLNGFHRVFTIVFAKNYEAGLPFRPDLYKRLQMDFCGVSTFEKTAAVLHCPGRAECRKPAIRKSLLD